MIIVIGGGLIGITTAYALSARGHQVTLIDQADSLATGASYANGGQLSWSHIDPLANLAMLLKLPAIMLGMDASIGIRAIPSPHLLRWGLSFISQCRPKKERANTEKLFKLAMFSRDMLHKLNQLHAFPYEYRSNGKLVLLSTKQSLADATAKQRFKDSIGCHNEILTAAECVALEPAIAAMRKRIAGGIYSAIGESADSYLFCNELAEHCKHQGQVRFALNCHVERIITRANHAVGAATNQGDITGNQVVIAAGMGSAALARAVGCRLPLLAVKGYSLSLPVRHENAPTLSITDMAHKTVYTKLGEQFRIAGIHQIGSNDLSVSNNKARQLLSAAKKCLPEAADYDAEPNGWAGLRPTTPDSVPIIGQTSVRNLWLNTGHGMLGWTLACGSAELLAGLMDQEQLPLVAEDYGLQR